MIGSYLRWITTIALFTCALITIPANMVILYCLKRGAKNSQNMRISRTSDSHRSDDAKITFILVGLSFIFFFFTIPNR